MGLWYKTCGLSTLPILGGEPVRVFVLARNPTRLNQNSSAGLYKPCAVSFPAHADEYGGAKPVPAPQLDLVLQAVQHRLVTAEITENFCADSFFEAVAADKLQIYCAGNSLDLSFTLMRADVVDYILANRVLCNVMVDQRLYNFRDIENDLELLVQNALEALGAVDTPQAKLDQWINDIIKPISSNLAAQWLSRGWEHYWLQLIHPDSLFRECFRLLSRESLADLQLFLREYLVGCFIDDFMNESRKLWTPGLHEGSQSIALEQHKLFIRAVQHATRHLEVNI